MVLMTSDLITTPPTHYAFVAALHVLTLRSCLQQSFNGDEHAHLVMRKCGWDVSVFHRVTPFTTRLRVLVVIYVLNKDCCSQSRLIHVSSPPFYPPK
jgi:hypothetical protein